MEFILEDILSTMKISCRRFDTYFNLVKEETIAANNFEQLSKMLIPFNDIYCQFLFFVFFDESQDSNKLGYTVLKRCLNLCWRYAINKRSGKLNEHRPNAVTSKHDKEMKEFSNIEEFAQHFLEYTYQIFKKMDWSDYNIINDKGISKSKLSYGEAMLKGDKNDMELAIFSLISKDFLEAIKCSNPFHQESTSISILQISESPFPIKIDSHKVIYNEKKEIIFINDISNNINSLLETDIQYSIDENISRNDSSGNIKSER